MQRRFREFVELRAQLQAVSYRAGGGYWSVSALPSRLNLRVRLGLRPAMNLATRRMDELQVWLERALAHDVLGHCPELYAFLGRPPPPPPPPPLASSVLDETADGDGMSPLDVSLLAAMADGWRAAGAVPRPEQMPTAVVEAEDARAAPLTLATPLPPSPSLSSSASSSAAASARRRRRTALAMAPRRGHRRTSSEPVRAHGHATAEPPPMVSGLQREPPTPLDAPSKAAPPPPAAAGGGARDFELDALLDAFAVTVKLYAVLGPAALAKGVDEGNIAKVRAAAAALLPPAATRPVDAADGGGAANSGAPPDGSSATSLRALLGAEKQAGAHPHLASRGQLTDPSAALGVVWLVRSMRFIEHVMRGLSADRRCSLSEMTWFSYRTQLEEYHSLVLKTTFRVAFKAVGTREAFVDKLAPGVDKEHAHRQMAELASLQRDALAVLCDLLREIGVIERAH